MTTAQGPPHSSEVLQQIPAGSTVDQQPGG